MTRPNLSVGTSVTAERDTSCEISIAYAMLYINVGEVSSSKVCALQNISNTTQIGNRLSVKIIQVVLRHYLHI
jgi:hypothetical protein